MAKTIYILNGPNLNLLGKREPDIYGSTTLASIEEACLSFGQAQGVEIIFRQSNEEASWSTGYRKPGRKPVA